MVETNARYREEIRLAREAARRLRWWSGASAIAGVIVTVVGLVFLLIPSLAPGEDPWDALNALVFVGLAGIVSAIAMYASSWNVALSASRLESQVDRDAAR